jgi:hypothetical protein
VPPPNAHEIKCNAYSYTDRQVSISVGANLLANQLRRSACKTANHVALPRRQCFDACVPSKNLILFHSSPRQSGLFCTVWLSLCCWSGTSIRGHATV